MKAKIFTVISILCAFAIAVTCLSTVNYILGSYLTTEEFVIVYSLLLGFYFFTEAGTSMLSYLTAKHRREKIQAQLDYERAIRRLSGEEHY